MVTTKSQYRGHATKMDAEGHPLYLRKRMKIHILYTFHRTSHLQRLGNALMPLRGKQAKATVRTTCALTMICIMLPLLPVFVGRVKRK